MPPDSSHLCFTLPFSSPPTPVFCADAAAFRRMIAEPISGRDGPEAAERGWALLGTVLRGVMWRNPKAVVAQVGWPAGGAPRPSGGWQTC